MTGLSKIAMIVGDDGASPVELARWLARFGIDSVHVGGEAEAMTLLDSLVPDLMVLTARPDSAEMLDFVDRAVRPRGRGKTRVILCSGVGDAKVLSAAVAEGADECLVSPFDADILRFKLEQTGVLAVQ